MAIAASARLVNNAIASPAATAPPLIKGVLKHCTDMETSAIVSTAMAKAPFGFAFCHLLGLELAPRLKAIARRTP